MIRKYEGNIPPEPALDPPPGNEEEVQTAPQGAPSSTTLDLEALRAQLMAMEFDQVAAYAEEQLIDIGRVTTVKGAVDKIIAALTP